MNQQTPEQYLQSKQIQQLLQQIVVSLLEERPENVEQHIIDFLTPLAKKKTDLEAWPSVHDTDTKNGLTISSGNNSASLSRRRSEINPSILTRHASCQRRKGMSSRMTSTTEVSIHTVPKDSETFTRLLETVKNVDLFSFLQAEQRETLVNAMFKKEFNSNDVIIKQGDSPDNFYIIESGNCSVFKTTNDKEAKVAELGPGRYFGELALLSGSTRTATVIANDKVVCWAIDQTTYLVLLKEQHVLKRQRYCALLRNMPFLKVLQDYEIMLIADALQPVNPEKDSIVVKQGDNGEDFYIILDGECTVRKSEGNEPEKEVGKLRTGAYFGEIALLHNAPRAATIVAGEKCKLVKLDRPSFQRLLGPCMQIFIDNMKLYQSSK